MIRRFETLQAPFAQNLVAPVLTLYNIYYDYFPDFYELQQRAAMFCPQV